MNELQKYVVEALKSLIKFDNELIKNQPKEECINHRFAQHLEEILRKERLLTKLKINVDVEYDKYKEDKKKSSDGENIRPDIIAHQRKSGVKNNLIAIEAKKKYISKKDKHKIVDLVNNEEFKYSLGVGVAYLPDKNYMKINFLLSNNTWEIYRLNKNDFSIVKTQR
jgi:hypothetical protein